MVSADNINIINCMDNLFIDHTFCFDIGLKKL